MMLFKKEDASVIVVIWNEAVELEELIESPFFIPKFILFAAHHDATERSSHRF